MLLDSLPSEISVSLFMDWGTNTEIALFASALTNKARRDLFLALVFQHIGFVVNLNLECDEPLSGYDVFFGDCFRLVYSEHLAYKRKYDQYLKWISIHKCKTVQLCLREKSLFYKQAIVNGFILNSHCVTSLILKSYRNPMEYDHSLLLAMFTNGLRRFSADKVMGCPDVPATFSNLIHLALHKCELQWVKEVCKVSMNVQKLYICASQQSGLIDYELVEFITMQFSNLKNCLISTVQDDVEDRFVELVTLLLERSNCIQRYVVGLRQINTGHNLPPGVRKARGLFTSVEEKALIEALVDQYNNKMH